MRERVKNLSLVRLLSKSPREPMALSVIRGKLFGKAEELFRGQVAGLFTFLASSSVDGVDFSWSELI